MSCRSYLAPGDCGGPGTLGSSECDAALSTRLALEAAELLPLPALLALVFSQGVSYLRARGEGLGAFTKSGVMTRPERVVLMSIGLIVDQIMWVMVIIAVVSCLTLFQRMFVIGKMLNKQP